MAFGSIFSATLGYSRVPYAAALDGNFFSAFARVHPTKRFPYISLLALGATSIVICLFFSLFSVIRAILAMRCLIQFVGQALGLMHPASSLESGPLAFPHVALSRARRARDCRLDRYFHFHGTQADVGLACSHARGYSGVLGTRAHPAPVALPGGRLLNWLV